MVLERAEPDRFRQGAKTIHGYKDGIMDLWLREAQLFKPILGGERSSGLMSFLKIGN